MSDISSARRWLVAAGLAFGLASSATGCGPTAAWSTVTDSLDRTVLSVWGTSAEDVYFAGGVPAGATQDAPGKGPLAMHFDGTAWQTLDASAAGTANLWWVSGTAHDDVWFVGEQGTALHWDGAAFTRFPTGTTATLFGLYAAARDDAWAVGGTPGKPAGDQDVLLHWDGAAFHLVDPPKRYGALYLKASGTAADNVFVSGADGLILHYDGSAWSFEDSGVTPSLFSVAASGSEVLSVGGPPFTVLSRSDGAWSPVAGFVGSLANGVAIGADGTAFIVAVNGVKYSRTGGAWIDQTAQEPKQDLHAVWTDGKGNAFAVGGNFDATNASVRIGVIGHYGPSTVTAP